MIRRRVAREVRKANCNDGTRYCVTSSHPQTEQELSSEQSGNVEQSGDEGRGLRTVCCHAVLTDTQRRGAGAGGMEVRACDAYGG
jgi:hypothetical protein